MNNEHIQPLQKREDSRLSPLLGAELEGKLAHIVRGGKMDINELFALTDEEKDTLRGVLTTGLITLAGEDRQAFLENTEALISDTARNEIWEQNHRVILWYVDYYTRQDGRIPSITRLSYDTGLSRVTITKHLKEYYSSPAFKEKQGQIELLRESLLMKVYSLAHDGDMKAARLFMDTTAPKQATRIKTQNNYVQNNTFTLTEEQLKSLPQKQQAKILELIRGGKSAESAQSAVG